MLVDRILYQDKRLVIFDEDGNEMYDEVDVGVAQIEHSIRPPTLSLDGHQELVISFRTLTPDDHRLKTYHEALKAAHHALTTVHGLEACDGAAPSETFPIDVMDELKKIDAALNR